MAHGVMTGEAVLLFAQCNHSVFSMSLRHTQKHRPVSDEVQRMRAVPWPTASAAAAGIADTLPQTEKNPRFVPHYQTSAVGSSHDNMNQSYRPVVRVGSGFCSGQPELRPHNGLVGTSYGNQCSVRRGSDQLPAVQLPSSSIKQPAVLGYTQPDRSHRYSR
ncbi:hypothetical protein F7725_009981 [Dissostichus mawsoni]|uniref:Uncharacterized protein n=1 Tax=Dissostichus mawsoni TaxID=36200 RepID=A0A7J5XMY7_DISMA|nr:hypothetical protein F7725_009981 [Dissostichus mawsoni]